MRHSIPFAARRLLLALLLMLAIVSLFPAPGNAERLLSPEDTQPVVFLDNWKVSWGDSSPDSTSWQPFDDEAKNGLSRYRGTLWLQRTVPDVLSRDPYLFLSGMKRFEVFLDDRPIYRLNIARPFTATHMIMTLHPIRLNPDDAGKTITIRANWDRTPLAEGWNLLGDRARVMLFFLEGEWFRLGYAVLFLGAGLTAAVLYLKRRAELAYFWFCLLALSAGAGMALMLHPLQWFVDAGAIYYLRDLLLPIGMFAFVGFYGQSMGREHRTKYRVMKGALLAYSIISGIAGFTNEPLYWKLLLGTLPYLFVPVFAVVSVTLIGAYWRNRTKETGWLVRGYCILVGFALVHIVINAFPGYMIPWLSKYEMLFTVMIVNAVPNGLLLFFVCLAMSIVGRVAGIYREAERTAKQLAVKNAELEQFHRSLEHLVEVRTKELEEANMTLAATAREKAETLAEVSVLEERNRISHEIHDVVGHTLTAAIVQLEAAKKLADRDYALSLVKLDTVGGLIRKGLDDIRRSVRMLKDDGGAFDLYESLGELIRETEDKMGVRIHTRIEPHLPIGALTQRVIYHALQEGLTNGIRHGGCRRFAFALYREAGQLHFRLGNDGTSFGDAKPGFGLTAMMERVHLLGGTIEIGPGDPGDRETGEASGRSSGCRLAISLPLAE